MADHEYPSALARNDLAHLTLVIDAANVAWTYAESHGVPKASTRPPLRGLALCVNALARRGARVVGLAPRWWWSASPADSPAYGDDSLIQDLTSKSLLVPVPSGSHDDAFVLELAAESARRGQAVGIVSNDLFRDHVRMKDLNAEWLGTRLVRFMFVGEDFIADPDGLLKASRPALEEDDVPHQVVSVPGLPGADGGRATHSSNETVSFAAPRLHRETVTVPANCAEKIYLQTQHLRESLGVSCEATAMSGDACALSLASPSESNLRLVVREIAALSTFKQSIAVPMELAGRIIGQGGSRVRDLQSQTGTRIDVGRTPGADGTIEVAVTGTSQEHVALAVRAVEEIVAYSLSKASQPPPPPRYGGPSYAQPGLAQPLDPRAASDYHHPVPSSHRGNAREPKIAKPDNPWA